MKWLLLVLTLPTENASTRMRVWRALKSLGAVVLRDGVYLLPDGEERNPGLNEVAEDVTTHGGTAYVLNLPRVNYPFEVLFDRTAEYSKLAEEITDLTARIDAGKLNEQMREARKLRKTFSATVTIDFFPGEAQRQTAGLLEHLDERLEAFNAQGEPSAHPGKIAARNPAEFQGCLWATRRRPWVDRLASAWLIRRHIDSDARFLWLASSTDCPSDALGFDFDGASFSHIGERVTFETLMASFGLEGDAALTHMARIVHYLDVGGLPMPEAAGLEAMLAGMRDAIDDDDALLAAASQSFDYLYTHLRREEPAT